METRTPRRVLSRQCEDLCQQRRDFISTVALARLDGQSAADAAEAIAFDMPCTGQQPGNAVAQCRNGARATGEEHRIDLIMAHAGIRQPLIDAATDAVRSEERCGGKEGARKGSIGW